MLTDLRELNGPWRDALLLERALRLPNFIALALCRMDCLQLRLNIH
jgi:hypothetical protein